MFDQQAILDAEEQLRKKRNDADLAAELNRREAERALPELIPVDEALSSFVLRVLGASMQGGDVKAKVKALQEENRALRKKQEDLLEKGGFPRDYLVPKRTCPLCQDLGYVGSRMCSCLKKTLVAESARTSGIARLLERQNFETFDLSVYPDALLPGKTYSARDQMEKILNRCKAYADSFSEKSPSLLFIGGTGLGKTHLSSAIAKRVLEAGWDVVYDTVPNVVSTFEKERFLPEEESARSRRILEADLLILDDLGTEPQSKTANSVIYNLINTRTLVKGLPIIISTNLPYRQLEKQYDSPITSRLFGEFEVMPFQGQDVRRLRLGL